MNKLTVQFGVVFFCMQYCSASHPVWSHNYPTQAPPPSPYNRTLDREFDLILMKFEKSVKQRDLQQFMTLFHDEFDSEAWFRRYYIQMTQAQLDSFVVRRFGYVEKKSAGVYILKMSESRLVGEDGFLHRSFLVFTKAMKKRPYAFNSMTIYGEY